MHRAFKEQGGSAICCDTCRDIAADHPDVDRIEPDPSAGGPCEWCEAAEAAEARCEAAEGGGGGLWPHPF